MEEAGKEAIKYFNLRSSTRKDFLAHKLPGKK
jgi:hypothetical protein